MRTLPLVKRIVVDILATGCSLREYLEETSARRSRAEKTTGSAVDDPLLDAEQLFTEDPTIQDHRAALLEYLTELESMGCFYKDWNFDVGLVDFPAIIDDEEVFLCWRSDEEALSFYHRVKDGYAGRRTLPPDWTGEA